MSKVALYVPLEAKPGKEKEVPEFLKSALPLVNAESLSPGLRSRKVRHRSRFLTHSTTRPGATRISMARSPRR